MTGLELAEKLRADGLGIPIFLIVGSPSPTVLLLAAGLGIDRVLEKPADYEDLRNFVDAIRFRGSSAYPINSDKSARLAQGLPIFLKTGSETDFSGWHGDRRNIEIFLCNQFPEAQLNSSKETEVPKKKKSASPKGASQRKRRGATTLPRRHGL
jgi:CheY-like chemotaxis protein